MAKLEADQPLADEDARLTERDGVYAAVLAKRAAMRVFEATGGRSLALSNHMQRAFRDVFAAGSHVALNWDRVSANYGRSVVGLPADTIF